MRRRGMIARRMVRPQSFGVEVAPGTAAVAPRSSPAVCVRGGGVCGCLVCWMGRCVLVWVEVGVVCWCGVVG